jgi:hypothetical protein
MGDFFFLALDFLNLLHCRCTYITREKDVLFNFKKSKPHTSVISLIEGVDNLNEKHPEL